MRLRAFTLIEILATISVIGILATLTLGPIRAGQRRSRDAQRKSAVNLIAQSLDSYYANERSYPGLSEDPACPVYKSTDTEPWIPGLETYMPSTQGQSSRVPRDPLYPRSQSYYFEYQCLIDAQGRSYRVTALLENTKDPDGQSEVRNGESVHVYSVER